MSDLFNLSEKKALVTGGAGQIGEPVSRSLAGSGAEIVIADIDSEKGRALSDDIGGQATFVECDVTDENDVDQLFETCVETLGGIDVLVNVFYPKADDYGVTFEDRSLDSWRKHIDLELTSFYYLNREGALVMLEQGGGSIVNFASTYGMQAPDFGIYEEADMPPSPAHYSASKAGILNLTRYMASYLGEDGVRVNAISPAGVYAGQDSRFIEAYTDNIPMNRMAEAEDLQGAVVYLASDASAFVTGHNLVVDGGLTIS